MNPLAQQVTRCGMHQALALDPAAPGKAVGHDHTRKWVSPPSRQPAWP